MAEQLDTSKGWCCDGRGCDGTREGGRAVLPAARQTDHDLPADGQRKARERMDQAVSR